MDAAQLSDRAEIADLAVLYSTLLDGREWGRLDRCFLAEAKVSFPEFGQLDGIEELARFLSDVLDPLDATQHIVTNFAIELDGDAAKMTTYGHAQHVRYEAPGGPFFVMAGSYHDDLVRTAEGWRIARREMRGSWFHGNRGVLG